MGHVLTWGVVSVATTLVELIVLWKVGSFEEDPFGDVLHKLTNTSGLAQSLFGTCALVLDHVSKLPPRFFTVWQFVLFHPGFWDLLKAPSCNVTQSTTAPPFPRGKL